MKFKYNNKVKIVDGFYQGSTAYVIDYWKPFFGKLYYTIHLQNDDSTELFAYEDELELVNEKN